MSCPASVEITFARMRFLITQNPTNSTISKFIEDWSFEDGAPPPNQIVDDWLNLVKAKFQEEPGCCIAIHCAAGLGRAPVLVALALIESGMKYEDAVQFITQKKRGAFNSKQLLYLEKYRPKMRLHRKNVCSHCCVQ
ncbi:PREDICTED: protein tyrosine phosphatase type IVA 2-like isoform X3 [Mesitornis unicolor]|uniref:protein tyrosine phosphatase type IVA 2-like isoform X3 n=1 Tax=Mesitornis unicolor TaxID=54374 RepID=UPI0005285189|nr:PREDICTED: protein tyrosine phosphatase type IVA 2-like isoform X3 [Mesitornis unicolor]